MIDKIKINDDPESGEISLRDVVSFCKEGWGWIAAGLLFGLTCAVVYLAATPKQYEARALFRGAKALGIELESPSQLIERMKFPTFYDEAQIKACNITTPEGLSERGLILSKAVNPSPLKGGDIIEVTYKASSRLTALECLDAVMKGVVEAQNRTVELATANSKQQLALTEAYVRKTDLLQLALEKRYLAALETPDGRGASQTALLLSTKLHNTDQLASLRKSALEQIKLLEPPSTRMAELVEPIFAPEQSLYPKKLQVLLSGLFGGFMLGGLALFMRRIWRNQR